jgi:hypothetical protein
MTKKYVRKGKKPANKKAKPKPKKKVNPTIVNKNIVNIRTDQTPSAGARIPITLRDIYDTTPRIEQPQEKTYALIENQSKQLELFKTDLLRQQQDNYKTLSESVGHDLSVLNGDIQDIQSSNQDLLTQYEDNKGQAEEVQQLKKLANTFLNKPKKINLPPHASISELTESEQKIYGTPPKPKETDQIGSKPPKPKETIFSGYAKDSIFLNEDEPDKKQVKKPDKIPDNIPDKTSYDQSGYYCKICDRNFATLAGLKSHLRNKHVVTVEDVEDGEDNDIF